MVIPPPNVTGSLHMGHALNNTLQDILCRFERMRGRDVLWQPGTDHAGIATQMVVERRLAEAEEPGRREIGREAFVEKVWAWKAESGGAIVNQLKRLGASCDWSRERFTMGVSGAPDDQMVRAVTRTFVDLHAQGLIYRDKRLVNWDPKFQTAISDLEVLQVEVKGHLWHFDYPIVDEAGAETGEVITVATTRPETMLGDTAVAVHPDDERYTHLVGKRVRLPLVGRLIPIVADSLFRPGEGHRRGQDHARARLQRLRGRPSRRLHADQHPGCGSPHKSRRQRGFPRRTRTPSRRPLALTASTGSRRASASSP